MDERENYLRALEFRNPQWTPFLMLLAWPLWHKYREDLEALFLRHPKIFGKREEGSFSFDGDPGPMFRKGEYYRDDWGSVWYNTIHGLQGQVVEPALADWKALDTYQPPDPLKYPGKSSWERLKIRLQERKDDGLLAQGYGGSLFDRLYYLRGFENLMIDIGTDDPHLPLLIEMLTTYEMALAKQWISLGVDTIWFHTDMGMQDRLMISPAKFRKYIKPMFGKIFHLCRDAGVHVLLSSDGRLLDIVDDLIECGISSHDPQLRANTLAGIEQHYRGKVCANVDLDRQMFPFCRPSDMKQQVKEVVEQLGLPEGGLMVWADVRDPNTSLETIEAICEGAELYCLADKPG
ncbi:MAG: uroporphyrinogen decarboxylase family protein [Desulfobacterales bacterium]